MENDIAEHFNKGEFIDNIEAILLDEPQVECQLDHLFTKGIYTRQLIIPAGTIMTTKLHKTEHPFAVMSGSLTVYTDDEGQVSIEAPYIGVTAIGTRRVIHAITDVIWVTFHSNIDDETDLDILENRIIEPYENKVLTTKNKEKLI